MPWKDWIGYFDVPGFELRVQRLTRRGKLIEFAVVLVYEGSHCQI